MEIRVKFFFSFLGVHEIRGWGRGISTRSGPVLRLFLRVDSTAAREVRQRRGVGEEKEPGKWDELCFDSGVLRSLWDAK